MLNTEKMIDDIADKGWFYQENAFSLDFVYSAISEFKNKQLKNAGIGGKSQVNSGIRNDHIYWFEPQDQEDKSKIECTYFDFLKGLKNTFNQNLYLGINHAEIHYARYDKGGFYRPHLDNLHGKNNRMITFITYLNTDWKPEHGGMLKIHKDNQIIDIPPTAGSVIAFSSEHILHEVSPSFSTRQSLTGWLLKE